MPRSSRKNQLIVPPDLFTKVPRRRLEGDWFAVDEAGRVAFFAGGDAGAVPADADVERTAEAVDALARAAQVRALGAGYRRAGEATIEPVFDPPRASEGGPMHERPIGGYPHLVVAEDAEALRRSLDERDDVRDALASRGLAVILTEVGEVGWDDLHDRAVCSGCRVLSRADDPHPRAPEVLGAAGLFVFAHTGADGDAPYVRVVSPTIAADLADLETIVADLARRVPLPVRFDEHDTFYP